ncbi:hypothetical protein [Haliangium ochraceum]|uniref:hypothetical protein n=1 Tax=Haliangium ochraceum TaxID=80816 RepID=UPI0012698EEC|nr:hypothetical protein [Haliangium ochraceum]
MAKKQTRRSISVSRGTYERLKSYCETHGISMSQFVESRVGDFLGRMDSMPQTVRTPITKKDAPRDPDIKLTPDQIFTF